MAEGDRRGGALGKFLEELARSCGAAGAAYCSVDQIKTDPMFRKLCAENSCGNYGGSWMCPPEIGDISDLIGRIRRFSGGVLYQTVYPLSDSFDFEGMMAGAAAHAQVSRRLQKTLRRVLSDEFLHLTCGGCHLCRRCARRDGEPCRHPEEALPSLEGYGIDVCAAAKSCSLPYTNGENTVTYFGLVLCHDAHLLHVFREGEIYQIPFSGTPPLSEVLASHDLLPMRPCGGRGVCGKCGVMLRGEVSAPNAAERRAGVRLACQSVLLGDAETVLARYGVEQVESSCHIPLEAVDPMPGQLGAAVDIGTTTVVLRLFSLRDGVVLAEASSWNPQTDTAADVIGRIAAAMDGGLDRLRRQILETISILLSRACGEAGCGAGEVPSMVITGNTTMLYLLTGRDPACLSRAPFRADTLFGGYERLLDRTVYLPPCMDAFVGADIACAVLASGMCRREEAALLCDLGTNGEIVLWLNGRLYTASTAAGPAFEGAGISCGCGSVAGAVDRVWLAEDGIIGLRTIGGGTPVGICGSGLVDAAAVFLRSGALDSSGAVLRELWLCDTLALCPQDVSAIQLAKAAVAAGMDTLLERAGISCDEITDFYIAGGFGSRLDAENAAAIGLIPPALRSKVRVIGNAALSGAARLLLDRGTVTEIQKIAAMAEGVTLSGDKNFENHYLERLLFPVP